MLPPAVATIVLLLRRLGLAGSPAGMIEIGGRLDAPPQNPFQVAISGLRLSDRRLIFACVILTSLPPPVVFAVAQRRIISGITDGAVR